MERRPPGEHLEKENGISQMAAIKTRRRLD
jgi:hypothetical protein